MLRAAFVSASLALAAATAVPARDAGTEGIDETARETLRSGGPVAEVSSCAAFFAVEAYRAGDMAERRGMEAASADMSALVPLVADRTGVGRGTARGVLALAMMPVRTSAAALTPGKGADAGTVPGACLAISASPGTYLQGLACGRASGRQQGGVATGGAPQGGRGLPDDVGRSDLDGIGHAGEPAR